MKYKDQISALETNLKITPKSDSSMAQRAGEVKRIAKMPNDTIDTIYEKLILKKGNVPVIAVGDKKDEAKKEDKPKDGEIIPPGKTDLKVDGANQRVDVAAPSLMFNLAPSSVTVNPGNVSWAYTAQRAMMYAFVFGSGAMFGVLALLAKMKGIG